MGVDEESSEGISVVTESGDIITISADTVRHKVEEVKALEMKVTAAKEELRMLAGYLKALGKAEWLPENLTLLTAEENRSPFAPAQNKGRLRSEHGTWTSELLRIISDAPNGMTYAEIKDALADTVLAHRLIENPTGFYNGVARLEKINEAVKYKGRLFSRFMYQEFTEKVKRGEVEDLSGEVEKPTIAAALVDIINRHPEGVTPSEIVAEAGRPPVDASPASVYNNLSKVAARRMAIRDGGKYYPLNEMGRSQVTESSPDAGGVAAPPVESPDQ